VHLSIDGLSIVQLLTGHSTRFPVVGTCAVITSSISAEPIGLELFISADLIFGFVRQDRGVIVLYAASTAPLLPTGQNGLFFLSILVPLFENIMPVFMIACVAFPLCPC